jgi:hypothetical protein
LTAHRCDNGGPDRRARPAPRPWTASPRSRAPRSRVLVGDAWAEGVSTNPETRRAECRFLAQNDSVLQIVRFISTRRSPLLMKKQSMYTYFVSSFVYLTATDNEAQGRISERKPASTGSPIRASVLPTDSPRTRSRFSSFLVRAPLSRTGAPLASTPNGEQRSESRRYRTPVAEPPVEWNHQYRATSISSRCRSNGPPRTTPRVSLRCSRKDRELHHAPPDPSYVSGILIVCEQGGCWGLLGKERAARQ